MLLIPSGASLAGAKDMYVPLQEMFFNLVTEGYFNKHITYKSSVRYIAKTYCIYELSYVKCKPPWIDGA
jgi:hypothetical protein